MRRLILLFFALVMVSAWQACDYGAMPGENGEYETQTDQNGTRSSGLFVPKNSAQARQQPAVSTEPDDQQNNSNGNTNPDTNKTTYKSGIGKVVSPLRVTKGTQNHGDPKTW